MSRAIRSAPWLCAGLAAVLGPLVMIAGDATSLAWRFAVIAAGIAAALIGQRVLGLPVVFAIAYVIAAARIASQVLGEDAGTVEQLSWASVGFDVVAGVMLAATLAVASRRL